MVPYALVLALVVLGGSCCLRAGGEWRRDPADRDGLSPRVLWGLVVACFLVVVLVHICIWPDLKRDRLEINDSAPRWLPPQNR